MEIKGRILAVDPGEKRIGIAVSDPTQTLARPLTVIKHVSRSANAQAIARLAEEQEAVRVIIGHALDSEGLSGLQAKLAERLAEAVRAQTQVPVELWDESGSTQQAQAIRRAMGGSRKSRSGHLDDLAAAVILQSYLDAQVRPQPPADDSDSNLYPAN